MIVGSDSLRVAIENLNILDVFVLTVTVGLVIYFIALLECIFKQNQEFATTPEETSEKYENKSPSSKTKTFFKFFTKKKKKVSFNEKENQVFIIM